MSDTGSGRIIVTSFEETSDMLTHINGRLQSVEATTATIEKIWRLLKYATPAMIGALLAGLSHESIIYKLGSALVGLLQNGTAPTG